MKANTQMTRARAGEITASMLAAAAMEGLRPAELAERIARGSVCLPCNSTRPDALARAIGQGLGVKVNVNVGVSDRAGDFEGELGKAMMAARHGADALMDLSTGRNSRAFRRRLVAEAGIPIGTVPIYDAASSKPVAELTHDDFFQAAEAHASDGVDFQTIHVGLTKNAAERLDKGTRLTGIVSRGGGILYEWMRITGRENPFAADFDRLLEICGSYDVTLSLGDGLRPGSLADSTDAAQVQELLLLGEFAQRARDRGVQVMIEGPGHIAMQEVEANVLLAKKLCGGVPFYVLGPLVTDIAPGYDHITAAIGGAMAARAGADFLCVVTPAEHLRLPDASDVREGLMAARLAAHVARGLPGAVERDRRMSAARARLDWAGMYAEALDPERARTYRAGERDEEGESCSMCGELCPVKRGRKLAAGASTVG